MFPADIILLFDKLFTEIYRDSILNDYEKMVFDRSILTQIVGLRH